MQIAKTKTDCGVAISNNPCAPTQLHTATARLRLRLPDPRPHTPRPRLQPPTSLFPARPAHYWRELVAGTTSSREGPTRNVSPLAPAGPPDFGALRARGKLLLPFGPCVTSVATLGGLGRAVLRCAEAEVSGRFPHPSLGRIAAQARWVVRWALRPLLRG